MNKRKLVKERAVEYTSNPPFPHNMLVELTNGCNHECIFCDHKNMKRKKGIIDKDFLNNILEQAYKNGTREVGYYLTGEPLICPEIEQYIEMAHDIGYEYIYMTTNGALAKVDIIKRLVDKGLNSLKFSINAGTRETYKKVHGRDDFDKVIKNLQDVIEYRRNENADFALHISFVRTKLNCMEEDILKNRFIDDIDEFDGVDGFNQAGTLSDAKGELLLNPDIKASKLPCDMIFNRLHISYEGFLIACCFDFECRLAVADLRKTDLKDAWNSELLVDLRKQHLSGNLQKNLCYNCINGVWTEIDSLMSIEG